MNMRLNNLIEVGMSSLMMYSYGPLHKAKQKQGDQLKPTYSSSVRIQGVAMRTCWKRWTIGRGGERGSGISVLMEDKMMMSCKNSMLASKFLLLICNLLSILCLCDVSGILSVNLRSINSSSVVMSFITKFQIPNI